MRTRRGEKGYLKLLRRPNWRPGLYWDGIYSASYPLVSGLRSRVLAQAVEGSLVPCPPRYIPQDPEPGTPASPSQVSLSQVPAAFKAKVAAGCSLPDCDAKVATAYYIQQALVRSLFLARQD
jgi:hypothetical protein